MHSTQISDDPRDILKHDCSLDFVENQSDFAFMPTYWGEAASVFDQLLHDLNEQQNMKANTTSAKPNDDNKNKEDLRGSDPSTEGSSVIFVREGGSVKVPELRVLGDGAMNHVLRMMPEMRNNMNDKTPVILHRFVTVPLEDMMEL